MEALDAAQAPGPISPSQRRTRTAGDQCKCINMFCVPEMAPSCSDLVGGRNAAKSQDLGVWGRVRFPLFNTA